MWNYSLFWLTFFIFIQQFLSQIELQQNLQLNESFDQSAYFFWAADKTSDIYLICVWICYLIFYFSKVRIICYYMCYNFSCLFTLIDKKFYIWHLYLIQKYCKLNSVYFYLSDYCALYLVKNCMLLDYSMFQFSNF